MTVRRRLRCVLGVLAAVVLGGAGLVVFGDVRGVEAHAFLVRTTPAEGERLEAVPREVSLEFSEPFVASSARLEVAVDGEAVSAAPDVGGEGRVLRSALATDGDGIYVVAWEVTAEDGHQTAGEFAFGVGEGAGDIPAARQASTALSPWRVLAGVGFFAGMALAAGSLAAAWVGASRFRLPVVRGGLLVAQAGALVAWSDALVAEEAARQQVLLGAAVVALAVAMLVAPLPRRWPVAAGVGGAAVAWSARGHAAVVGGVVGGVVDVVHLVAGAAWVGALGLLVADLRREGHRVGGLTVARRYAQLAAVLVGVLAAAGTVSAVLLLVRPSDLWSTGYGRALTGKGALVALALGLAVVGRRALARRDVGRLRRTTPVEAAALGGVLVLTGLLVNLAPPATTSVAGASLLGPAPITGPVARDAGLAGHLTVAAAAGAGQLRVEVFAPGGEPATDAEVDLEADLPDGTRATLLPRPCGPGCFTQQVDLPEGATRINVTASAPGWAGGLHVAHLDGPPRPSDPALLDELVATMRNVPRVSFTETTTSGPGSVVTPMSFEVSGAEFVELEPWAAGTADDVQPLAEGDGVRMYLPGDRIWVTVWLDDEGRITRERIVAMSHEIEREDFHYPAP